MPTAAGPSDDPSDLRGDIGSVEPRCSWPAPPLFARNISTATATLPESHDRRRDGGKHDSADRGPRRGVLLGDPAAAEGLGARGWKILRGRCEAGESLENGHVIARGDLQPTDSRSKKHYSANASFWPSLALPKKGGTVPTSAINRPFGNARSIFSQGIRHDRT